MKFWDGSATVPLLSQETPSSTVTALLRADGGVVAWRGTWTECAVAISRLRREGTLSPEGEEGARAVLDLLAGTWIEVEPARDLRLLASLLSRDYPLKAADALQLAAALRWCEGNTIGAEFVCLDKQLRRAALEEGFDVLPEETV
ncbi:PIN domain-containing protein [Rubrobacter marinus]|uniref:PIN domain-containing protein n=1 Tax=Rubrobacter marinus TaxID=2653852 RepID=A0A6G8PTQ9_9ACTN|nr:type II toxin-antitoxin system VapC family toxin [Rubrobacter marinus]QIN77321.1 PIN domain-containing protein [Rubrobacter marinus]